MRSQTGFVTNVANGHSAGLTVPLILRTTKLRKRNGSQNEDSDSFFFWPTNRAQIFLGRKLVGAILVVLFHEKEKEKDKKNKRRELGSDQ